jgi:hypothetical protein
MTIEHGVVCHKLQDRGFVSETRNLGAQIVGIFEYLALTETNKALR